MSLNEGIVIQKAGEAKVVPLPVPELPDDFILIRVHAIGLNPTDWKHIDHWTVIGGIVGCDYAGIVLSVGKDVTKDFKKGGTRVSFL